MSAILLIAWWSPAQGRSNESLARSIEALNWITEQYPPFNFRDPDSGEIRGISVDILMRMFSALGVNLTRKDLKILPWARGYRMALKEPGTVLFSTTYTDERTELFRFVGPIVPTRVSLIALKSRALRINTVEDMAGLRIGVIRDDVGDQLVRALGIDPKAIIPKATVDNLVRMLYRKRLDAIAYAEDIARQQTQLAGLDPTACEAVFLLKQSEMGYAFHRSTDAEILDALQGALDELRKDGTVESIRQQYLK